VFVSCVQKQLQEYDFQFSAWPTDFDVADVEGYVLFITRSVFRIRTGSGFSQVRGSGSRRTKMTHKNIKSTEFSCLEVLDVLF
jgi:hypothetical protein